MKAISPIILVSRNKSSPSVSLVSFCDLYCSWTFCSSVSHNFLLDVLCECFWGIPSTASCICHPQWTELVYKLAPTGISLLLWWWWVVDCVHHIISVNFSIHPWNLIWWKQQQKIQQTCILKDYIRHCNLKQNYCVLPLPRKLKQMLVCSLKEVGICFMKLSTKQCSPIIVCVCWSVFTMFYFSLNIDHCWKISVAGISCVVSWQDS